MPDPETKALGWASAAHGAEVTVVRGPRRGGSPWLLRAGSSLVVLRVVPAERAEETRAEVTAMACAARSVGGLAVAELLGHDLAVRTAYGLVLTLYLPGTSTIPAVRCPARLRALGVAAARISAITVVSDAGLPTRSRPLEGEDFARMRRELGAPGLLLAAEAAIDEYHRLDDRVGLVHGVVGQHAVGRRVPDRDPGLGLRGYRTGRNRPRFAALRCSRPLTTFCSAGRKRRDSLPATFPTGTW